MLTDKDRQYRHISDIGGNRTAHGAPAVWSGPGDPAAVRLGTLDRRADLSRRHASQPWSGGAVTREYVCADCGTALPVTLGRWACDECGGPLDLGTSGPESRQGMAVTHGWANSCAHRLRPEN